VDAESLRGSSLVSPGNGSVDNIRGLLQFFGAFGALNSITIDDGADTTADTVGVVPNLVYHGPRAHLPAVHFSKLLQGNQP
jgi:hypothetical protein